jgi:hypothetical protein
MSSGFGSVALPLTAVVLKLCEKFDCGVDFNGCSDQGSWMKRSRSLSLMLLTACAPAQPWARVAAPFAPRIDGGKRGPHTRPAPACWNQPRPKKSFLPRCLRGRLPVPAVKAWPPTRRLSERGYRPSGRSLPGRKLSGEKLMLEAGLARSLRRRVSLS